MKEGFYDLTLFLQQNIQPAWRKPIRLTQCCTQFKLHAVKVLCVFHLPDNVAFYLNYTDILGSKRLIRKGFELGTTLSKLIGLLMSQKSFREVSEATNKRKARNRVKRTNLVLCIGNLLSDIKK